MRPACKSESARMEDEELDCDDGDGGALVTQQAKRVRTQQKSVIPEDRGTDLLKYLPLEDGQPRPKT